MIYKDKVYKDVEYRCGNCFMFYFWSANSQVGLQKLFENGQIKNTPTTPKRCFSCKKAEDKKKEWLDEALLDKKLSEL